LTGVQQLPSGIYDIEILDLSQNNISCDSYCQDNLLMKQGNTILDWEWTDNKVGEKLFFAHNCSSSCTVDIYTHTLNNDGGSVYTRKGFRWSHSDLTTQPSSWTWTGSPDSNTSCHSGDKCIEMADNDDRLLWNYRSGTTNVSLIFWTRPESSAVTGGLYYPTIDLYDGSNRAFPRYQSSGAITTDVTGGNDTVLSLNSNYWVSFYANINDDTSYVYLSNSSIFNY
jgi:hypothetical protein